MTNERIFQISDKHLQLYKQHKGKRPDDAWLLSHIAGAVDEAVKEVNKIIVNNGCRICEGKGLEAQNFK